MGSRRLPCALSDSHGLSATLKCVADSRRFVDTALILVVETNVLHLLCADSFRFQFTPQR